MPTSNLATVRDISIIVLAIESIVVGILLGILTVQVMKLMKMLREEVLPILDATQETVGAVRSTTTIVGENLVKPVITASSYVTGVRSAARMLLDLSGRGRSR
jgi:hypothetical protein